ncbi:hypothetical protein Tco_1011392 [Tanacetum coccineum]
MYNAYILESTDVSMDISCGYCLALCYPINDSEDLGKFQAKADIGIFVGYAPSRKGYRIYNKRTRRLMETIHVTFDEMHQKMAPFKPRFDEYLEQSRVNEPVPSATEVNAQVVPPGTSLSTTIAQDAPSTSASSSTSDMHHPVRHQEVSLCQSTEGLKTRIYPTSRLSSKEGSFMAKAGTKGVPVDQTLYSLYACVLDIRLNADADHAGMSRFKKNYSGMLKFLEIEW